MISVNTKCSRTALQAGKRPGAELNRQKIDLEKEVKRASENFRALFFCGVKILKKRRFQKKFVERWFVQNLWKYTKMFKIIKKNYLLPIH
jgi:hypothetical protein